MSNLNYISEEKAREMLKLEVEREADKGFIIGVDGFINHLIDTGRIGFEIANEILNRHPSLDKAINSEAIRVQGYLHDLGKASEGTNYHEVSTANIVLERGESLGLVTGGTSKERYDILKRIASIILPDFVLFEALGGRNFPRSAVYPEINKFMGRIDNLRHVLSPTKEPLSIEQFALPLRLDQQIALYADLTNLNGQRIPISSRIDEIISRYGDSKNPYFDPIYSNMANLARPRLLAVAGTIDCLLED